MAPKIYNQEMKKLVVAGLLLLLLIFAFVYFASHRGESLLSFITPTISPTLSPTPSSAGVPALANTIIQLVIANNKITKGPMTVRVGKNYMVVLQITSDSNDELSLLGYNKHVFLQKGKMVILSFLSTIGGDFAYQLKNSQKVIGRLEVEN